MKHTIKITLILLFMFFVTQLIGILIASTYTTATLPYGISPPEETNPQSNLISIVIAIAFGVVLMLILMKVRAELFLRLWFFVVVTIALAISINALLIFLKTPISNHGLVSFFIALPLSFTKIFIRNIKVHNITELFIYPGIAVLFIPLLNIFTVVILLILISIYDIYAVWHAGFMQKMAKYQMQKVRVFSGFFIPYLGKKEKALLEKSKAKKSSLKKIKISVAILGGGDVVFPIILAGTVLAKFGVFSAIIVSLGATIALAGLFISSQKGKFYPAMPFITLGCFIALVAVYILQLLA